ncbi:hypothetical protein PTKIN_Ptkin02bG0155900 [Pterospermum kingtungense]
MLVLSRSLFLVVVIITLLFIRSFLKGPSGLVVNAADFHRNPSSISSEYWNLLWQDFSNEGLIKKRPQNSHFELCPISSLESKFVDCFVKVGGVIAMQWGDDISSGDSLEHYTGRVFIHVGSPKDKDVMMKWFDKNYLKRNQVFEVQSLERGLSRVDVLDWLMKNVTKEDYVVMKAEVKVVMKAEAKVVEEMIERRAIGLVDELFLECNNQ